MDISVNGTQRYQGNWLADGGLVVLPRSQKLDAPVLMESIEEVKISTASFDAQYGSGTAVFNQITKTGSNQFHGALYDYEQNDALNARSFFSKTVPIRKIHLYGGSLGLQHEIQGGWSEVSNRIATFDPTLTNPATKTPGAMWFAGDNGRTALQQTVKNTVLPRVGFAWTPQPK